MLCCRTERECDSGCDGHDRGSAMLVTDTGCKACNYMHAAEITNEIVTQRSRTNHDSTASNFQPHMKVNMEGVCGIPSKQGGQKRIHSKSSFTMRFGRHTSERHPTRIAPIPRYEGGSTRTIRLVESRAT
jgi:hypothetical protein